MEEVPSDPGTLGSEREGQAMQTIDIDPRIRDDPPRLMRRTLQRLARVMLVIAVLAVLGWIGQSVADPQAVLAQLAT